MDSRDGSSPKMFDRQEMEVVGPRRVRRKDGKEKICYEVRRRSDGARVELTYMRHAGENGNLSEVCSAKLHDGWSGERYDGCSFLAYRRVWDENPADDRSKMHWHIDWHSPAHDMRAQDAHASGSQVRGMPTTWPGHFQSPREATLESLMLKLLDQVDAGILRIESARMEQEGQPA